MIAMDDRCAAYDRRTCDPEAVVQDVFQTVWQAVWGYQPAWGSVSSWVLHLTRYQAINALQRKRIGNHAVHATLPWVDTTDGEAVAGQAMPHNAMRTALKQLPHQQQHVIALAYFDGFSTGDIATYLDEPPETIKTHMRLGLSTLRDLLRG